jgi:hypothetical protein
MMTIATSTITKSHHTHLRKQSILDCYAYRVVCYRDFRFFSILLIKKLWLSSCNSRFPAFMYLVVMCLWE